MEGRRMQQELGDSYRRFAESRVSCAIFLGIKRLAGRRNLSNQQRAPGRQTFGITWGVLQRTAPKDVDAKEEPSKNPISLSVPYCPQLFPDSDAYLPPS
jgi:hypothetical protein